MRTSPFAIPTLLALLGVAAPAAAAETLVLTPIAVSRDFAPVAGRYVIFGDMNIDNARRVTFTASLSSGRVGVFRTSRGMTVPLVLTGDDAPDDAGNTFAVPDEAASNARGDLAFISTIFYPARQGVFLMRDGAIVTLALAGQPAPTRPGEYFASFTQVRILDSGAVFFLAGLVDSPVIGLPTSYAVIRSDGAALDAAIAPGDPYGGERAIDTVQQFDVNGSGEVAALVTVRSAEPMLDDGTVNEIVRWSGGRLATMASEHVSPSPGTDMFRNFAITVDQVRMTPQGQVSFFGATNYYMLGSLFINTSGTLLGNERIVGQGDPTPLSASDRYREVGAFGSDGAGDLAFHATSRDAPAGAIFSLRQGATAPVAVAGQPRPDGQGPWHGFYRVGMNETGDFAFTDFQDRFVQVGVYLAHYIGDARTQVETLLRALASAGLPRPIEVSLTSQVRAIARAIDRDDLDAARRLAWALRRELDGRAGHSVPAGIADRIDSWIEDLILALGGGSGTPHRATPGARPGSRVFDTAPMVP